MTSHTAILDRSRVEDDGLLSRRLALATVKIFSDGDQAPECSEIARPVLQNNVNRRYNQHIEIPNRDVLIAPILPVNAIATPIRLVV
jgi:hypothetical protein